MSSGSYYSSSNAHTERNRESHRTHPSFSAESTSYSTSTSTSTHRATPNYPCNNDHAFVTLYSNNGSLVPITPMSHTPQGILPVPSEPDPSKKYRCPECSKCFDRPSALSTHKVTHTKEALFLCSECDRSFTVRSNRNRHMRDLHGIYDLDNPNSGRRPPSRYPSSVSSEASAPSSYYSSR